MNTVTHTTAQRLKEAGWEKETERVYNPHQGIALAGYALIHYAKKDILPAPTFAEIWAELPEEIDDFCLNLDKQMIGYFKSFYHRHNSASLMLIDYPNITEAAAALWLRLKEEGIL